MREIATQNESPAPRNDYRSLPRTFRSVSANGRDGIVYGGLFKTAMEAAVLAGWTFRSYSSLETLGTQEDFIHRQLRSFPTLILYRDGVELGRHIYIFNTVAGILAWENKLLGVADGEAADGKETTL